MKRLTARGGRAYIGIVIVLVIIMAIAILWFLGKPKEEAPSELAVVTQNTIATADRDGDGLKDWEEVLWKTDSDNPDTDADGTKDGDEIRTSRNPLKPGPDDKIVADKKETTSTASSASTPSKSIDIIAEGFVENYTLLSSKAAPAIIKNGLNQTIIDNVTNQTAIKQYTLADIRTLSNSTNTDYNDYISGLALIFGNYNYYIDQDEPNLLKNLLKTRSPQDQKKLADAAVVYKKISDELIALPVPSRLSSSHLVLLNLFYGMHQSVLQMSQAAEDPLTAMVGLNNGATFNSGIVAYMDALAKTAKTP